MQKSNIDTYVNCLSHNLILSKIVCLKDPKLKPNLLNLDEVATAFEHFQSRIEDCLENPQCQSGRDGVKKILQFYIVKKNRRKFF